ncbi:hypothetical protein DV707_07965 [Halobellus limi]|uniref:Uncharacterized protein n=1 Tax=Halobellus limi TaxID=699433 RepID=A0A4D6H378_9EURY|nr:hypothetical protein [Halobellus limi]QCC47598.1 hypothetical protein DV707_07965 [Halobellus limi]
MGTRGTLGRLVRWIDGLWRAVTSLLEVALETIGFGSDVDLHTRVTFRAVTDAVLPETPALGTELGDEHVPGGLAIALDEFVITYVDDGFQLGLPHIGPHGNIRLADPIAHALDFAALTLCDRSENESEPSPDRPVSLLDPGEASPEAVRDAAGAFSKLSRKDRLRAISILDEFELSVTPGVDDLFEFDAGLVGQLVVGFTEMIYYSEWQGYDEFTQPRASASTRTIRPPSRAGARPDFPASRTDTPRSAGTSGRTTDRSGAAKRGRPSTRTPRHRSA